MSSNQVVPTPMRSGLDRSQALTIISKWVTRYTRRCSLRPGEPTSPDLLIKQSIAKRIIAREQIFERHLPISWPRFVAGIISLLLVFSDVFRSGLSVSNLHHLYPVLQPDEVVNFGTSWNHSVFKSSKDEAVACNSSARVWSYKFDSTSISWRAFARYFDLEFPACILYKESCPSTRICGNVAFQMVDSLVNGVASVKNSGKNAKTPSLGLVTLTLRTQSAYIDRFHQLLIPKWFTNVNWRTTQALYYSPEVLATTSPRDICFPRNPRDRSRIPRFCQQLWINFQKSCASSDPEGKAVRLLQHHTLRRVQDIQVKYPSLAVDLTLLESQDDLQVNRGGLSSLGFRWSDVSTIIRARNCSDNICETLYVDDYRYETGLMVSDIVQWYRVIAALRIIGQSYFFLRGIGLILSCYFIHNKKMTIWTQLQKACQLFTKVPTQCVVYGSPFPVACYVLAHLLDAPFTYQVLESHYLSKDGIININLEGFISYTVVQMRNVWIYSLVWHVVVKMSTMRWMGQDHQPNNGITGVPEFLLSGFSSITLSAQYRSISFRSTKILEVMVLPDNVSRAWEGVKYRYSFGYRGRGNTFLGGVFIDIKFLLCLLFTVVVLRVIRTVWINYRVLMYGEDKYKYSQWFLLSPTPVPYSAGILWPTVSMCVHWTSDFFCIQERNQPARTQTQSKLWDRWRCLRWRRSVLPLPRISNRLLSDKLLRQYKDNTPSVRMNVNTFRYIQHQMKCLHGRSSHVEANVAFMNAVLMSDPLVFFQMAFNSTELAYYQSILRPTQILLLPVEVVNNHNEFSRGLQLLQRVSTAQISWTELVQCG